MDLHDDLRSQLEIALAENTRLRDENCRLREQLGLPTVVVKSAQTTAFATAQAPSVIKNPSTPDAKVALFKSLFRGREDVFAMRWEGRSGKLAIHLLAFMSGTDNYAQSRE
ncbi:MAG TPA: hypothetical protein VGK02_05325 [Candidatus Aquicultor sp.]|jgi:hypothetical protein